MVKTKSKTVKYRPPIVALLGHVDHGKTTILDKIRKTSVQEKEVGGITQCISCWTVPFNGKDITFVDTPGHEAFDLMRLRGGEVADIVLLIIAANDGVKPQTKESIEIIKSTGTPAIVVLNKIDIEGVDLKKVKRELSNEGIVVEELGGDYPCIEVSGKTGKGIPELLDMVNLVCEVNDVVAREPGSDILGEAFVVESLKDKSKGNVSTIIVTSGKFLRGNLVAYLVGNLQFEKIKGLINDHGENVESVDNGYSAQIIGLSNVLNLGDKLACVETSKADLSGFFESSDKTSGKQDKEEESKISDEDTQENSEEEAQALLSMLYASGDEAQQEDKKKTLNIVLKCNSKGTLQAVVKSLEKAGEGETINIARAEVGNISIGDIEYAQNLKALVIGFNVAVEKVARDYAEKSRVLIKIYDLIYDLVEEVSEVAEAMEEPESQEETVGKAKIKQIFQLSDGSKVLGVRVESGEIKHGSMCKVIQGENVLCNAKITSIQQGKEKVKSSGTGSECGLILDTKCEPAEGDTVECFRIVRS